MALSIDWGTSIITVPQADLTFISGVTYELDVDAFRLELKSLEASEAGIGFLKTHNHNTETLLGGVTYARVVKILAPYTVTFEDGQYVVNLVGANNNVIDVSNQNQVSIRGNNSAGLVSNKPIWDMSIVDHRIHGTFGAAMNGKLLKDIERLLIKHRK